MKFAMLFALVLAAMVCLHMPAVVARELKQSSSLHNVLQSMERRLKAASELSQCNWEGQGCSLAPSFILSQIPGDTSRLEQAFWGAASYFLSCTLHLDSASCTADSSGSCSWGVDNVCHFASESSVIDSFLDALICPDSKLAQLKNCASISNGTTCSSSGCQTVDFSSFDLPAALNISSVLQLAGMSAAAGLLDNGLALINEAVEGITCVPSWAVDAVQQPISLIALLEGLVTLSTDTWGTCNFVTFLRTEAANCTAVDESDCVASGQCTWSAAASAAATSGTCAPDQIGVLAIMRDILTAIRHIRALESNCSAQKLAVNCTALATAVVDSSLVGTLSAQVAASLMQQPQPNSSQQQTPTTSTTSTPAAPSVASSSPPAITQGGQRNGAIGQQRPLFMAAAASLLLALML